MTDELLLVLSAQLSYLTRILAYDTPMEHDVDVFNTEISDDIERIIRNHRGINQSILAKDIFRDD